MDTQTVISILGLLGIGSLLGGFFNHLWEKKKEREKQNQDIKENHYHTVLLWMRCLLYPNCVKHIEFENKDWYKKLNDDCEIKDYARTALEEYYFNLLLYAPDDVIREFLLFLKNPNDDQLIKTAFVMRKDLWGNKFKMNVHEFCPPFMLKDDRQRTDNR